mgnify:CR=1 FL=1
MSFSNPSWKRRRYATSPYSLNNAYGHFLVAMTINRVGRIDGSSVEYILYVFSHPLPSPVAPGFPRTNNSIVYIGIRTSGANIQ